MKNNVLRLAMILPDLNYGGIENVACCMSRMFTKNGYEVYFFLNTYDKEKSFSHIGKIKMVPYKMWEPETKAHVLNMVTVMDQAYSLKKIKQKYKIDISISFHPYNHIFIAGRAIENGVSVVRDDLLHAFPDQGIRLFTRELCPENSRLLHFPGKSL